MFGVAVFHTPDTFIHVVASFHTPETLIQVFVVDGAAADPNDGTLILSGIAY